MSAEDHVVLTAKYLVVTVVPHAGEVIPRTRTVQNLTGKVAPRTRTVENQTGEVKNQTRTVEYLTGGLDPHARTVDNLAGVCMHTTRGVVPPTRKVVHRTSAAVQLVRATGTCGNLPVTG